MSTWIKMRTNLITDGRIVRVAERCKVTPEHVVGALHHLWSIADEHTQDGVLTGWSRAALSAQLRTHDLIPALIEVDWLAVRKEQKDRETLYLPRFDKHNGASTKRREAEAARKERYGARSSVRETPAHAAEKKRGRERERIKNPPTPRGAGEHAVRESAPGAGPAERRPRGGARRGAAAAAGIEPPGFAAWWAEYPARRKAARAQCLAKWTAGGLEARSDEMRAALGAWKTSEDWLKNEGQFIPAPMVWLNQGRWESRPKQAPGYRAPDPARDAAERRGAEILRGMTREARYAATEQFRTEVLRGMQVTVSIEDQPRFRAWLSARTAEAGTPAERSA